MQGKVLGGSSSINGMVYNRCQPQDYDAWAELGNPGWGFKDVLPYFCRSECRIGKGDDACRGRNGPLTVCNPDYPGPLYDHFIAAAEAEGIPFTDDYNGAAQEGVGDFQFTIDTTRGPGRRISAAVAFLNQAKRTRRVTVRTGCLAEEVLFEGRRAVGVRYIHGGEHGQRKSVMARREVILAAGAINTPRLLQISGVAVSTRIQDAPEIQPNYLDTDTDRAAIVEVVRMARRLMHSAAFAPFFVEENFPGKTTGNADAEILDFVRQSGGTAFHHMGTARMGPESDPMSVVDARLRLRGASNLRVADCSIMPTAMSGNTNAPGAHDGLSGRIAPVFVRA